VRVVVSASTMDGIEEGMVFDRELMSKAVALNLDAFGESGEFHSLAEVWSVSRSQALGL
jgi:diphthamide synthase (EF-2-diphthine--ammonia ligase)